MGRHFSILIGFLLVWLAPILSGSETATLPAASDVTVDESDPDGAIRGPLLMVGKGGSSTKPRYRSFLIFNLSAIPRGSTVQSAVLRLNVQSAEGTVPLSVQVHRVLKPWTEAGITWKTQPAAEPAPASSRSVGAAPDTFHDFAVTGPVQAWLDGAPNEGLLVRSTDETVAGAARAFASRENTKTTARPQLIVTYDAPPDILIEPPSFDFGSVAAGGASSPLRLTIKNVGQGMLSVTKIESSSPLFPLSSLPKLPASIGKDQSVDFLAQFKPLGAGTETADVTVASNDPDAPSSKVRLTGTGIGTELPEIRVSPAGLSFPERTTGTVSRPREVKVESLGPGPLVLKRLAVTSPHFVLASRPALPLKLEKGGSIILQVASSPQAAGSLAGKLLIGSDDPDEGLIEVSLSGSGKEPEPPPPPSRPSPRFRRGDLDGSGTIDIADPIRLLGWLFLGDPAPGCVEAADADSSGAIDVTDAIFILGWLFLGGPPLPLPGSSCGEAPGGIRFPCEDSPCEPLCPPPIPGGGPGPGEDLPPEERDAYTVYIQNVFLIPDLIRENLSDDFTTLCDADRGLAIAEKILEVDADIVILTEAFVSDQPLVASDGMLAIEARLAGDCERREDCYRTRIGHIDDDCSITPSIVNSGLALYSKFPALSLGDIGLCFPDRCVSRDCALEVLPGILSTVTSEYVRFFEFTDAADDTGDSLANKGVAHVRLLNVTKDRPRGRPLDVYFSHTQSDPDAESDNSDIREVQFEDDIVGFLHGQPGFGNDGIPDHDTLFAGDLNIVGREPGFDPAGECAAGERRRETEWSLRLGGECSDMVGEGFRDAWWLLNPVQDPGPTATYGAFERLDYLLFNFTTDPSVATPLPSSIYHLRRYRLQNEVDVCDIGLDGDAHDELVDLTDHYGLIARIGPRDHHASPRHGLEGPFDPADEPAANGGQHRRMYEGAYEDLVAADPDHPERRGPFTVEETIAARGGNHWFYFSRPGTYSFTADCDEEIRLEYYLARDISTALAPAEGPRVFPPRDPSCPALRSVGAFAEPFYVRVLYGSPEVSGVPYRLTARAHDCASYEYACWLTESAGETSAIFAPDAQGESHERWYKLRARRPSLTWTAQTVSLHALFSSGDFPDDLLYEATVYRAPEEDGEPGDDLRLAGPFEEPSNILLASFPVPPETFEGRETSRVLAIRVRDLLEIAPAEPIRLGVAWETDLRTVTLDRFHCTDQCEDDDDATIIFDLQDDETRLELFVDRTCGFGAEIYSRVFRDVDEGSRINFENRAPFLAGPGEGDEGEDFEWIESEEEPAFYQARGLTVSFVEGLFLRFTGIDDPSLGDDNDELWCGNIVEPPCEDGEWEGSVCRKRFNLGGLDDVPGGNCSDSDSYRFELIYTRSAPSERIIPAD